MPASDHSHRGSDRRHGQWAVLITGRSLMSLLQRLRDDVNRTHHDEYGVRQTVQDLGAADIVVAVPEDQCFVHRPSGEMFHSDTALGHVRRGWEATTDEA